MTFILVKDFFPQLVYMVEKHLAARVLQKEFRACSLGALSKLSDTFPSGFMMMNEAQEADVAASANRPVKGVWVEKWIRPNKKCLKTPIK